VLGGLAIVVGVAALAAFTVATLGAGPVIVGAVAVGAMAAGGIAVGVQAASDIARGEVSDFGEYATTALRESLIGAVTGAIFGPLGVGGSIAGKMALGGAENALSDIASQMMQGKKFSEIDWKSVGMSAGLGVATVGVVNSKAGKALGNAIVKGASKVTPQFVKNGVKASGEAFQSSLSKLNESGSKLGQKIKNGLDDMTSPVYVTPDGIPVPMNRSNIPEVKYGDISGNKRSVILEERGGYGSSGQEVPYMVDFFEGADGGVIRGLDAPTFYSVKNSSDGSIYVSTDKIRQRHFADIVNNAEGEVTVLTGAHGTIDGGLEVEKEFFDADLAAWGNSDNVKVLDINKLSPDDIKKIVNEKGTTICAWCYSERSQDILKAMGLIE